MARRAARTALLCAIGGLLIACAAVFFMIASFIALADRYDALTAALAIGGFLFVMGLIFLLVALLRGRRPRSVSLGGYGAFAAVPPAASGMAPGVDPATPAGMPPASVKTVLGIAAGAAVIGLILGRRV
ncbi:hypothetical protein [Ancylobacter sp. FA202]|uniref:hypothetical protein n=1 Tax=Ancylobacter sp. FA202 TaxID=1111106 RepID=UPI001FD9D88B|nr:hypothetical protein [Ancylobacter sp. FA202]